MTAPMYLMLVAAVFSALAWRWNATSAALAFAYFASQAWWIIAGGCDVGGLFMIDVTTIALIFCKAIVRCPDTEFRSARHQLRCMVAAFTVQDRIVLAIFPLAWVGYVLRIDELARWWILYGLSLLQFIAAGWEAFGHWRRDSADKGEPEEPPGLMFAVARVGARG